MKGKKFSFNFIKSLRFRLLIILMIMGIIPSIIVTKLVTDFYFIKAMHLEEKKVETQCNRLSNQIIKENYLNNQSSPVVNSKIEQFANDINGRVILINQDFVAVLDTYGEEVGKTIISPMIIKCFRGEESYNYNRKNHHLNMAVVIKSPDVKQLQGVIYVSASLNSLVELDDALSKKGIIIVGIMIVLSVLLSYFLSAILVKPFAHVTKAIEELTDGYQSGQISVPDYTETALITDAFNKMLSRMKVLDQSRNEFVSNVSHELKTPMTSVKVLADSLYGQSGVPEELYQEFLGDITAEIDRENKIINDLLSLVKMDKKADEIHIAQTNINKLLEDILKRLRPIANQRHISLILDCYREVEAEIDEVKLTLAISNLVENGIKYNVDEGWVKVTLDADHKFFYISVADSGMGIPEESLDRIFERFYRVDKSHSREIGGTGLGLAITRSSVARHHGTISVISKEGEGTTFTVRIPLLYIVSEVDNEKNN